MAGELVIRYWPVDADYQPAQNQGGAFGLALWVQPAGSYNPATPTLGALVGGQRGSNVGLGINGNYEQATVLDFAVHGLSEGQYAERAAYLLSAEGAAVPLALSALPLEVVVVGLGSEPYRDWQAPHPWGARWNGSASYAGGAVEFGIYVGGEYVTLAAFWVDGEYFQPKPNGASWANPALPQPTDAVRSDPETGLLYITLASAWAPPAFWTSVRGAYEV